jgi:tRNA pseudouridine38-40 synthase
MRFRAIVEYDGTDFAGWQLQPDAVTIQGTLEKALATILGHPVRIEAAGRTDAGVHARGQVVAFETVRPVDPRKLLKSWNALAGPAIAIHELTEARAEFDPRRDAKRRTYEYRVHNAPFGSPFTRRFAWHVHEPLDAEAMNAAATLLVGEHDFSAFQAADCDAENSVREVLESRVTRNGVEVVHRIVATAFLRHMVRAIVGTLVEVGHGERSVADFERVFALRERTQAGPTAPAHGLCLVRVDYD